MRRLRHGRLLGRLLGHSNVLDSHVYGPQENGTRSRTHTLGHFQQIGKVFNDQMDLNPISRSIEAYACYTSPGQVGGDVPETTFVQARDARHCRHGSSYLCGDSIACFTCRIW